jgi:hypothetical protein
MRIRRMGRTRCSADRDARGNAGTRPHNGVAVMASAIGTPVVSSAAHRATNGGAAVGATNGGAAHRAANCSTPSRSAALGERVRRHRCDQEKTKADTSQPFHHLLLLLRRIAFAWGWQTWRRQGVPISSLWKKLANQKL